MIRCRSKRFNFTFRQISRKSLPSRRWGAKYRLRTVSLDLETIDKIYNAIHRHVTEKQLNAIIDELLRMEGNQSFRKTVQRLAAINAQASH